MPVKKGEALCIAHQSSLPLCQHCGTQLPTQAALQKHIAKPLCPALKRRQRTEAQPYYQRDANFAPQLTPSPPGPLLDQEHIEAAGLLQSHLRALIRATLPKLHVPPLEAAPSLPEAPAVQLAWANERDSSLKMEMKHFPQIASLASHALACPPLPIGQAEHALTIMDMAAGRAYTALYLAHVAAIRGTLPSLLAVDRASTRLKADRALRAWTTMGKVKSFRRLTIDLQHLDLSGVPECTGAADLRAVGKHLCGIALDLSLTALTNFATQHSRARGSLTIVFASCCRKLCKRHAFGHTGRVWQQLNISDVDFSRICTAAHWGLDTMHNNDMADIGRYCRYIVDAVRVMWLNSAGWDARLGTYTDASPENACIVATWEGIEKTDGT